ncbi:hypothetical protein ABZ178_23865 [Streptomyces massasporeus]|uniref:hypothetical protein n=1 Tax=Streptomyces massasporeus TaxID=67324 RepID=UPI0033AB54F4
MVPYVRLVPAASRSADKAGRRPNRPRMPASTTTSLRLRLAPGGRRGLEAPWEEWRRYQPTLPRPLFV